MRYLDPKTDLIFKKLFVELSKFKAKNYRDKKLSLLWLLFFSEIKIKQK